MNYLLLARYYTKEIKYMPGLQMYHPNEAIYGAGGYRIVGESSIRRKPAQKRAFSIGHKRSCLARRWEGVIRGGRRKATQISDRTSKGGGRVGEINPGDAKEWKGVEREKL